MPYWTWLVLKDGIMKSGEVWSSPAVGEKVGQGCPCLVSVGKVVCISSFCGYGLGHSGQAAFVLGCAVTGLSLYSKDVPTPLLEEEEASWFYGCHFRTCLLM